MDQMHFSRRIQNKIYCVTICLFFCLFTSCGSLCGDVSRKVKIGMSQTEVRSLCGSPTHIETTFSLYETQEEWVYKSFFKVYDVVFINSRVVAVYEKGM